MPNHLSHNLAALLSAALILMSPLCGMASDTIAKIIGPDNEPVADAVCVVSCDSTVSIAYTDENGMVTLPDKFPIDLEVQALGYNSKTSRITADTALPITLQLERSASSTLNELVVQGDRSLTVKRLANGQRFFLSPDASAMKDPFMALTEIPAIISNPFTSTVQTLDGKIPLILVNGMELNSGISPISPQDIEYVEVIDVIPAKYLARGVTSILNIKLRDKRPPYIWTKIGASQEVPTRKSDGAGHFEVGNEKISVYAFIFADYTHNDDEEGWVSQDNAGYSLDYDWKSRRNKHQYKGKLILKWAATPDDYFAVQAYADFSKSRLSQQGEGSYDQSTPQQYLSASADRDRSTIYTASAYYKHIFGDKSELASTIQYNDNGNVLTTAGDELFGSTVYRHDTRFDNSRKSGSFDLTYSKTYGNATQLVAGSTSKLLRDRVRVIGRPTFNHTDIDEYLYMSLNYKWKKLLLMLSPGVQATWIKAADTKNHYIRPRGSASATYVINDHNSLQLAYTLTNQAPGTEHLNPFNTSTDSLIIQRGNPSLVPQIEHDVYMHYTANCGNLYSSTSAGTTIFSDMITPCGSTDASGVYTSSFRNHGNYKEVYAWTSLSYKLKIGEFKTTWLAIAQWRRYLYSGSKPKDAFIFYGDANIFFRRVFLNCQVHIKTKEYTDISLTRNIRPIYANLQLNYAVTDDLYLAICLQGFAGSRKRKVLTQDGTFKSVKFTEYKETGFRPFFLVQWTFRKNPERKIKLDNVLNSTEQGIKLK